MADARNIDFFGGGDDLSANPLGTTAGGAVAPLSPAELDEQERRRRQRILDATATTTANINQGRQDYNAPVDAALASATARPSIMARGGATPQFATDGSGNRLQVVQGMPGENAAYEAALGTVSPGVVAGGTPTYGSPGTQTLSFTPPAAPAAPGALNPGALVDNALSQGDQYAQQAATAQPTINPAHEVTPDNIAALTPVIDPSLASNPDTRRALDMAQNLVDRILGTPLQTPGLADQNLSSQLAIARSARGGAGAVQDALGAARDQAPQLQAQAAQQSIQEQQARAASAGQAASIFAGVANQGADRAVQIAQANQGAGLQVMNNLTTLTGQDLQFDQTKMQVVGQLARDYFANAQAFAQMDTQKQIAQWNNAVTAYGIDKSFDAAVKKISADEGIGPFDAFKLILGGAAALPGLAALI